MPLEKKFFPLQSIPPGDCAAFIDLIFYAFPSVSLILLAMLIKNPYSKDLFKGISVWGSCCAFAYVLINVFQSRYRNILSLVPVSFN